jgi:hypothetical protein
MNWKSKWMEMTRNDDILPEGLRTTFQEGRSPNRDLSSEPSEKTQEFERKPTVYYSFAYTH